MYKAASNIVNLEKTEIEVGLDGEQEENIRRVVDVVTHCRGRSLQSVDDAMAAK